MKNNFKFIKNISSNLLLENMITTANNSFSYNKFIQEVKRSPILKTQFVVYSNIDTETFPDRFVAEKFLEENMLLFNRYSSKDILNENEKLVNRFFKDKINEEEDPLFDLILEYTRDRKIKNIIKKAHLFNQIVENLIQKEKVITEADEIKLNPDVPVKTVIKRATEILNEKYSFLSDSEKNIVKAYINDDAQSKEKLFNSLINENLNLVKKKLFNEEDYDKEELDSLNLTEAKLKESKFSFDTGIGEFSKLIELKESLL